MDTNRVRREQLTLYIVPERMGEETKNRREDLRFFVFVPMKKHNILCTTKKKGVFSHDFSGNWKLSGSESCAIMTVTD